MNIITAAINSFGKSVTCPLYQWDYGQILMITGITLPDAYEVNFAQGSDTCTVIGTADGVEIPDEYLQNASDIIAYLYLHTGETDGETVYELTIPVIARPEPSDIEPTPVQQDVITQAIAALNTAVNEAEGYAQDAQEAAESIPEHVLVYDEQTLTDSEKAQARANIGAIGSADIPTEIFWVTYQSTTAQQISSAISSGKYPVLKYGNGFDSPRIIAPLTNQFDSYTFECVQGSEFIQFVLSSGTWSMTRIRDHNIKYDAQSLTTSQKSQARSNIGAISSADVPTKTSELTNDSGYVTQWTAPVRSVNGQTGAVQLHSVLYDSQTLTDLQKSQARQNIDVPSMDDFDTVADNAYEALGKADWAVSYNPVQSLTDQEKADARANIDAVSSSDINAAILASLITDTASGDPCAFPDGASAPVVDCTVAIVPKQSGSGTPSPSNVRPISGWTEMMMKRTGKNLCKSVIHGYINTSQTPRKFMIDNASESALFYAKKGATYHISSSVSLSRSQIGRVASDTVTNGEILLDYVSNTGNYSWTATWDGWTVWYCYPSRNVSVSESLQVEVGSTATEYEPYNGQTYTQSWTPTVYGGTLDLTTGLLTVTYGMVDLGTLTWTIVNSTAGTFQSPIADAKVPTGGSQVANCLHPFYVVVSSNAFNNVANTGYFVVNSSDHFVRFCTGDSSIQPSGGLVYELAEPTTIQLTPTEVSTILGSNTFSADTGSVTVEYRADTELWVEGHVPSKTSQLTNDSGFITASNAPVRSVNGKTGVVVIGNATTSANGLMSATDKSRLDDLYADYSSAMTALGV